MLLAHVCQVMDIFGTLIIQNDLERSVVHMLRFSMFKSGKEHNFNGVFTITIGGIEIILECPFFWIRLSSYEFVNTFSPVYLHSDESKNKIWGSPRPYFKCA